MKLFGARVDRVRTHAARFPRSFWIVMSGEAIQSVGFGATVPFLALYFTETVGLSAARAGGVLLLFSVVGIVAQPLGGVLADRIGRRPIILGGLAVGAVAVLAFSAASSLLAVALLSLLWGLGYGVFEPAAGAFVTDVAPRELRTEAFGLWRVVNNAGFAVGPPLAALVIWLSSLRGTFVLAGVTVLVFLAIAWRALPETRPDQVEGEPPARFREALHDRLLLILLFGSGIASFIYALFESALPVFLHEERGLSIATWGIVFGINPVLVAVFQYPISRWSTRHSTRGVLALGLLILGLAMALVWPFESLVVLVAAVVLFTLGEMLQFPVATAAAADLAPERLRGSYQGALNLAFEGSWGPAAVIGLALIGAGHGGLLFAAAFPLGVVGALVFLLLPGGRVHREPPPVAVEPARP
ncbi:MAG: MFS transporter [Actinobacteria bacterium]|nr:MFS transporter [Actinomycetota bacterium]